MRHAPQLRGTLRRVGLLAATATVALAFVAGVFSFSLTASAGAWCNGPNGGNGFGTHDWVLNEAQRLAAARGVHWLRLSVALPHTDDPDTVFHDYYYHVYDIWSASHYGNAPRKVGTLFARAVRQLRDGNARSASITFGLLAHYYADVCEPLHTDQCAAEEAIHSSYESQVEWRTDSPGEHRAWVVWDGFGMVRDGAAAARSAAAFAHRYYFSLVRQYSAGGYTSAVGAITRRCLNRAVNGLADLILSAGRLAR